MYIFLPLCNESKNIWHVASDSFFVGSGSIKKRTAPLPPGSYNVYGTLPNSHSRTPSDPIVPNSHIGYHTLNHHKRSPSSDSNAVSSGTGRTGATSIHLRKYVFKMRLQSLKMYCHGVAFYFVSYSKTFLSALIVYVVMHEHLILNVSL
jgi:hypothetical protein